MEILKRCSTSNGVWHAFLVRVGSRQWRVRWRLYRAPCCGERIGTADLEPFIEVDGKPERRQVECPGCRKSHDHIIWVTPYDHVKLDDGSLKYPNRDGSDCWCQAIPPQVENVQHGLLPWEAAARAAPGAGD